jgi:hypothetical protein
MPTKASRSSPYNAEVISMTNGLLLAQTAPPADYAGLNGFLPGARSSLILDVVVVAMLVVLPLLAASIWLVKRRRNYGLHKLLQLTMATVLLATVVLFEVDIRLHGWMHRAAASPFFDSEAPWRSPAGISLIVHLLFAVPTVLLWATVVGLALRHFGQDPRPGPHSRWHVPLGWAAAIGMGLTAVTGWVFYWLAFVAG